MDSVKTIQKDNIAKSKLNIMYTILVVLYPLFSMYRFFGTMLSIADVCAIVIIVLMMIKSFDNFTFKKLFWGVSALILIHACLIYFVNRSVKNYDLIDLFGSTLRLILIYFVLSMVKEHFIFNLAKKILVIVSVIATAYLFIQLLLSLAGIYLGGGLPILTKYAFREDVAGYVKDVVKYGLNYRPRSFFEEPAHFCQYLIVAIALLLFDKNKTFKKSMFIIIFLGLGIIFSMSLLGWVALFLVSLIWFLGLLKNRKYRKTILIILCILPIILAVLCFTPYVQSVIFDKFVNQSVISDERFAGFLIIKEMFANGGFVLFFGNGLITSSRYCNGVARLIFSFGVWGFLIASLLFIMYIYKYGHNKLSLTLLFLLLMLSFGSEIIFGKYILIYLAFLQLDTKNGGQSIAKKCSLKIKENGECLMKNIIIIVGGDHHNGLGLARIFGKHNCAVHSYVISDLKKSWIAKSKHIISSKIFSNEKLAFDDIIENYKDEKSLPFIIPYSDGAAYELDMRLDEFKHRFYVPSINQKQGMIASLMDKGKQYIFAQNNGIKMAKTALIDLNSVNFNEIESIPFPQILKPCISAYGDKKDISICYDINELKKSLDNFKEKQYNKILLQEYMKIDYEIVIVAAIMKNDISFSANRVIRRHMKGGTNSFSQTIVDDSVLEKCKKLLYKIKDLGFNGLIDVEAFIINGEIYLNEINWRNSGGVFRSIASGFDYPYWWIKDTIGISNHEMEKWKPINDEFSMTEHGDIRNVINKNITLFQWMKDRRKTNNFALKFKGDMKPVYYRYFYYLNQLLFSRKKK